MEEVLPSVGNGWSLAVKQAGRRGLRRGKYLAGSHPIFLPLLLRATPEGTTRAIRSDTQLVIEGFPRSGNTFAVFAFRNAQGPGVPVVGHVHHESQIMLAVRRKLPTLVVVRDPEACLASYLVHSPHGRPRGVLKEYIGYHRALHRYLDDIVIGDFRQVTTDFSATIATINDRFGTMFAPFDQSEENVDRVFAAIDAHNARVHPHDDAERVVPRPSALRKRENARAIEALNAPDLAGLLAEARAAHQACLHAG